MKKILSQLCKGGQELQCFQLITKTTQFGGTVNKRMILESYVFPKTITTLLQDGEREKALAVNSEFYIH